MSPDESTTPGPAAGERGERQRVFVTTHWSVVLSAQQQNSPQSAEALESLCRTYWYPLYVFVRRQGYSSHDAQDLTQGFFARLLEKDYLKSVDQEKGRFRTYLIVALKRFLANQWDREHALKRGGDQNVLSLDTETAEDRYRVEPAQGETADRIYDRRWALTLLDRTLARLQEEFATAGKAGEFQHLKSCLTSERGSVPYSELAEALGQPEGTVRVAAHRLRKRYREIFREEIAHTVADPDEVEDEIRYLMSVLSA